MKEDKKICLTVSLVFISVNAVLACVKLYVGLSTNMLSVLTDSYNNFYDTAMGAAVLIALLVAIDKGRKEQNKASKLEELIGFSASLGIVVLGLALAYKAAIRLVYPTPVRFVLTYAFVLAASAVVKFCLGIFVRRKNRRLKHTVYNVLELDCFLDTALSVMTLIAFVLQQWGGIRIDAIFGLAVAVLVVAEGIRAVKKCGSALLASTETESDTALNEENKEQIDIIE